MLTPTPYPDGYRLIDGTDLNDTSANPNWSITEAATATVGGNVLTSTKIIATVTNITTVGVTGAGVSLPQALPGRILIVQNNGANDVTVFAEGNSTIDSIPGNVGVILPANSAYVFAGLAALQWGSIKLANVGNPIFTGTIGYLYSDGVNPVVGVPILPVTGLPLTNDQSRAALLAFLGTTGSSGTSWLVIVENDLAANHNDSQDPITIRYNGALWPVGGTAWVYVRGVLKAYFGWSDPTADARILAVQTYAFANR